MFSAKISILILAGWVGIAMAELESNPFLELYKLRVGINEMNVLRQEALRDLASARLGRTSSL